VRRRWPRSSRIYLGASVATALMTGVLLQDHLTRLARMAEDSTPSMPVVVATSPVPRGSELAPNDLEVVRYPRSYVPPGAFDRISEAAGRVALSALAVGEVVTETRLARVRAGPVASLVPEGLRAFAVPTSLPPEAIAAGDHVDILATYGSGQPYTETVVEDVEVLLVMGGRSPPSEGLGLDAGAAGVGPGLTLLVLVAPAQQEELAFARAFADLAVTIAPASE
jgi:Flp pilus assembly protein CpaB